ncbi:MAG: tryptophan 7-halogenase [Acidobacteria bacterium]|nr:tryptophan 7-halogenase [Acidobacteriota bacterium]
MPDVTETFDVVILGGGPAGAATALSLREHNPALSLAIIESSAYERPRIGETLPPNAEPLLRQLGIWESFLQEEHAAAYGTCSTWGSAELLGNDFFYQPYNRGWHLDRRRFDALLVREAEKRGVALRTNAVLQSSERHGSDLWRLTINSAGQEMLLQASFVVDATGRRALFATQRGVRKIVLDHLLGVFLFFGSAARANDQTLVEAWAEGWWYSALLPDACLVAACMTDGDIVKKLRLKSAANWFERVQETLYTKQRLTAAVPLGEPSVHAAHTQRLERVTGAGWLAAGDAASVFDPLSSQGITKALRSGLWASYAICDHFKGTRAGLEKYETLIAREFKGYLATRAEYYGQERRWHGSPFWQRRHEAKDLFT